MSALARPDGRRRPRLMQESWFRRHRRLMIIGAAVLIVAAVFVTLYFLLLNNKKVETEQIGEPAKKVKVHYYSPLTGLETTEQKTAAPITAVMIENSFEARPQSGLAEAGVIFEAIAEGGITRFVVLYQESEPALIGPVRSVRPYYIEWAAAFDPSIAHVGGSYEALNMVRSGKYGIDLDQFFNDSAYWRTKDRYAPHNMYTDYAHLSELIKSKSKTTSKFTGFTRQEIGEDINKEIGEEATKINLDISSGQFAVAYNYDEATDTYKRSVGGKPHLSRAPDKTTTQIAPDVVIAIHVQQSLAADRVHNKILTIGSGEVFVFQNGRVIKGTWSKDSAKSQMKFLDKDGQEIKLKRGQTWITAVPNDKSITWKASPAP